VSAANPRGRASRSGSGARSTPRVCSCHGRNRPPMGRLTFDPVAFLRDKPSRQAEFLRRAAGYRRAWETRLESGRTRGGTWSVAAVSMMPVLMCAPFVGVGAAHHDCEALSCRTSGCIRIKHGGRVLGNETKADLKPAVHLPPNSAPQSHTGHSDPGQKILGEWCGVGSRWKSGRFENPSVPLVRGP